MGIQARLNAHGKPTTIERAVDGAQNDYGIPVPTWATLATVQGWFQPTKRKEKVDNPTEGGAVREDGIVFMRVTDLTEKDRLVYDGKTYRIMDVHNPAGKDQHFEVMVKRVTVL